MPQHIITVNRVLFVALYLQEGFYYREKPVCLPDLICKMHVKDIFAAFYACEIIAHINIAKIKLSGIKDGLQYIHTPLRRRRGIFLCTCGSVCPYPHV